MRTHEKERTEYVKLKIELAQKFPYDIDGYCDRQENFVREIKKLALSQFDETWENGISLHEMHRKKEHFLRWLKQEAFLPHFLLKKGIFMSVFVLLPLVL